MSILPRPGLDTPATSKRLLAEQVQFALTWLKRHSTRATLEGMARYSIPSDHAYGVAMKDIKTLGKTLGRNQPLAVALWATGVYEARMLASFVGDPEQLTPAQMDRWCKDFDNWAFCDAMSFNLFDRTPHAWTKVAQWSTRRNQFEKRTAFALLWSLTVMTSLPATNSLNRASPSSNAKPVTNATLSRRPRTWPYAPSVNAIVHSIPRPRRWRGV